ncbi:MAG: hypothetical protein EPO40_03090 [Myxococcaceae bacterium]|nr:MAG: hypothetical protein EPO40_03090 [Myxococcaceae bacterium]
MANTARLKVKGIDGVIEASFDVEAWRGDVLETLEAHLGDVSFIGWARRWAGALQEGARISEFRTRDIIGLVYLAVSETDPEATWQSVARAIAPYSIEFVSDDEPAAPTVPPVTVGVSPNLGQQVPDPGVLAPALPEFDPTGAHEAPPVPTPGDFYRTP